MSAPLPPLRVLAPELPVMVFADALPVASISEEPVRVKFSTLFAIV